MTQPVDWPSSLVQELADRRAIIVVGSGLSAQSRANDGSSPPTWSGLVEHLVDRCILSQPDKEELGELVASKQFPQAAQGVRDKANPQEFAAVLRAALQRPSFAPSAAHNAIAAIDAPVVINLNFDRIYENLCLSLNADSYVISHYFNEDFVRNIRSPQRVLMKLHGSVDDPARCIFSSSDYRAAQTNNAAVFETVAALLRTRTVLFIGCGFQGDPDVDRLLTENALKLPGSYPHFALLPNSGTSTAFDSALQDGLNVDFIRYPIDDSGELDRRHIAFSEALEDLRDQVLESRQLSV